jgi:hypothetical protein
MVTVVDKPRPSTAEKLVAEYGHAWDIWRDLLPQGGHGDWIAQRYPAPDAPPDAPREELRAPSIDQLRSLLEEAN